jgi:hypothetical protein
MLGYISSTRKKSCYGCVKAKRRCDLGYPFCKRCCVKGYDCKYPNANATPREARGPGVVPAEVVIRQATPDFALRPSSILPVDSASSSTEEPFVNFCPADVTIDPFFFQTSDYSGSSSSPESFEDFQIHNDWAIEMPRLMPQPPLTRMLLPPVTSNAFLIEDQTLFIIRNMLSFVTDIAYTGSTTFLHKTLYQTYPPSTYQDCIAISALYMCKTPQTQPILASLISSKIAHMTRESATWTLTQHLAAVQALTIYQVIRLYDPDLHLQQAAEPHNALLERWAALLWKRSFNEAQSFASDYASYVFHESLRRTVLMSVFVRCGWSCLTCGGLADQVPVLAQLPVTKDLEAWECEADEWNVRPLGFLEEACGLVSYGDLALDWSHERGLEELGGFRKFLIAACRGKDDPRLLR